MRDFTSPLSQKKLKQKKMDRIMKEKVTLISENKELYRTLRRALRTVGDIEIDKFTEESLKNKNRQIFTNEYEIK